MQQQRTITTAIASVVALGLIAATGFARGPADLKWQTIVNNGDFVPGTDRTFSSYNQPSINNAGLVVFRARTTGPGEPIRGIWMLDLLDLGAGLIECVRVNDVVPDPNNNEIPPGSGELAGFNEFPSFPRVDIDSNTVAFRGQHQPVWKYMLPDGSETNVGTSGVYVNMGGPLITGASLLGAVEDPDTGELVFPWFQVPGAPEGTRFDVFPGAPAISKGRTIVFKGNFTDPDTGEGYTGVYFRDVFVLNGTAPTFRIADSTMVIPNQPAGGQITFDSTAPPSAAHEKMVFLGLDNEEAPSLGGIYLAQIKPDPDLEELVAIGGQVPGEPPDTGFTFLGEALSFDGRFVGFWGAWGEEVNTIVLECPEDGNADVLQYCNELYPDGFVVDIPVNQGIFVYDTFNSHVYRVARTGEGVDDFLYWVFSGHVPGQGGDGDGDDIAVEEDEFARWRSSPFVSVAGIGGQRFRIAYKATFGEEQGIFAWLGPNNASPPVSVVDTMSDGSHIDPDVSDGSVVSSVGIERDGLRNGRLVMALGMLDEATDESWAGLYVTDISELFGCEADTNGDGVIDVLDFIALIDAWGPCQACAYDFNDDEVVNIFDLQILLSMWGPCP